MQKNTNILYLIAFTLHAQCFSLSKTNQILLINSVLSTKDFDIQHIQYASVKYPASHKGLYWTKYNQS